MERRCDICGCVHKEIEMLTFNTGRTTHWLCWDCYKHGHGEVTGFETQSKRRKMKEANKK